MKKSFGNKRPASHAGSWYEDDPDALTKEIKSYIENGAKEVEGKTLPTNKLLRGVVVPHAGICYSGPTAGASFSQVKPENYDRVIIIGPSHFVWFSGVLLTSFDSFETPFGEIKVDRDVNDKLLKNNLFNTAQPKIDVQEHSIEMETPFIKYLFDQAKKDFKIVTMIVGDTNLKDDYEIAKCLKDLYLDPRNLFVISSDFCHWGSRFDYTFYDKKKGEIWQSIEYYDMMAVDIMKKYEPKELDDYFKKYENTICGRHPITIMLCMIDSFDKEKKKEGDLVCYKYAQSEKVTSMYEGSVSYAGCGFYI